VVAPWSGEHGKIRLGCLFVIAVVVLAIYVGKDFGFMYWRYYQLQDQVKTQVSFAPGLTDKAIRDRLVAECDTLNIPIDPKQWEITRAGGEITISAAYRDSVVVDLPGFRRVFYFELHPGAHAGL
jgi:hypothetical protein